MTKRTEMNRKKLKSFLLTASLCALWITPLHLSAQSTDEIVTQVVEQFNHIENSLSRMETMQMNANHAESDYGIGDVTIWVDHQTGYAKTRNELYAGDSTEVQEMWMQGDQIVFVYEKTEWRGEEGQVDVNELRYYMNQGQVVREMSRHKTFQNSGNLDISNVPHETLDDLDPEYAISLYEAKQEKGMEIAKISNALAMRPQGAPRLESLPYRILLDTLSPDGQYAVAFSFEGIAQPNWFLWEDDRYAYYDSLGAPVVKTHLVSLTNGAIQGDLDGEFDPTGRMYAWAEWAPSSGVLVYGEDARWYSPFAGLYKIGGSGLVKLADLGEMTSQVAIEAMKKVDHPYVIDSNEANGFIQINSITDNGNVDADYRIESKFEGDRNNAYVHMAFQFDYGTGQSSVISSTLPDYIPSPSSWEALKAVVQSQAMQWMSAPPALDEYLQTDTACDSSGSVFLYNQFGGALNPTALELIIRRPLFLTGPHMRGQVDTYAQNDFGRYDPISIAMVNDEVTSALQVPAFVAATQVLYNIKFRSTLHDFQEALVYWESNPQELERQKQGYLNRIANQTLPEGGYYLLEGEIADQLMNQYSNDFERQLGMLTALRFWLRRACDGTYGEFASMSQRMIQTYDRAFFASKGLPDMLIEPQLEDNGTEDGILAAVMEEGGAMGVNERTPLDLATLKQKLAGFRVMPGSISEEGDSYPGFKVMQGSTEVLFLTDFGTGDKRSFEARSTNIQMKSGVSTGDTFGRVFGRQYPMGIFVGLETDVGGVVVDAPGSEHIRLIFREGEGQNIALSDPSQPPLEELKNFILVEMRWQP